MATDPQSLEETAKAHVSSTVTKLIQANQTNSGRNQTGRLGSWRETLWVWMDIVDTPLLLRERLDALSASAGARKAIAGVPMCRFSTATSIMFTTWLTLPTAALHTAPNENEISNGATPHLVNRPTRWNIDDLYFPSQIQRNIVLCYATEHWACKMFMHGVGKEGGWGSWHVAANSLSPIRGQSASF